MRKALRFSLLISVTFIMLVGCTNNESNTNRSIQWIKSTTPKDKEENVNSNSNITIEFNTDMDEKSLNKANITIVEGKHSSLIIDLFEIKYDKQKRTLILQFKSDYGSSNGIDVTLSSHIKDIKGEEMGKDYQFGFNTK